MHTRDCYLVHRYQGEANVEDPVSQADYCRCLFPASMQAWRTWLGDPSLPFGFGQIAGFSYGSKRYAADVRQAQLSALQLHSVFMSTAVGTGDWYSQHPSNSDKQSPAKYLAEQALAKVYGRNLTGVDSPLFVGHQKVVTTQDEGASTSTLTVSVLLLAGGEDVRLSTEPPPTVTQSSMLGCANNGTRAPSGNNYTWGSVPRNRCVTDVFPPTDDRFPPPRSGSKCETCQHCAVPARLVVVIQPSSAPMGLRSTPLPRLVQKAPALC